MSKKSRNRMLLVLLITVLAIIIVLASRLSPDTTAGLREITNRDQDYYKVQVIQTMTAQAH